MKFEINDGGRAAAGYKGKTGDCVCRAICIVTGQPYQEVYDRLAQGNESQRVTKRSRLSKARKRTASHGINVKRKWFRDYMAELGLVWVPTMKIGQGCKVHLADGELPAGRLIVSVSKHWTAVIDGVINDTFDPSERGCTTYPIDYPKDQLPKKAYLLKNGNGWGYYPQRCVYGYYYLPEETAGEPMENLSGEWKVNTPALLKEIVQHNPTMQVLAKPIQIFANLLAEVGVRASEINDPQLNALMIRLAIYEVGDPYSDGYNEDLAKKTMEIARQIKKKFKK